MAQPAQLLRRLATLAALCSIAIEGYRHRAGHQELEAFEKQNESFQVGGIKSIPLKQDCATIGLEYELRWGPNFVVVKDIDTYHPSKEELLTPFATSMADAVNGLPLLLIDPDTQYQDKVRFPGRAVELITGPMCVAEDLPKLWKEKLFPRGNTVDAALKVAANLNESTPEERILKESATQWVKLLKTLQLFNQAWGRAFAVNDDGTPKGLVPGSMHSSLTMAFASSEAFVKSFSAFLQQSIRKFDGDRPTQDLLASMALRGSDTPDAMISGSPVIQLESAKNADHITYEVNKVGYLAPHQNFLVSMEVYYAKNDMCPVHVRKAFESWLERQQEVLPEAITSDQEVKGVLLYFFHWLEHHRTNVQLKQGRQWNKYKNSWRLLFKAPVGDLVRALGGERSAAILEWFRSQSTQEHCEEYAKSFTDTADADNFTALNDVCAEFIEAAFKPKGHPRYAEDSDSSYSQKVVTGVLANGQQTAHDNYDAKLLVSNKDPIVPISLKGKLCTVAERRMGAEGVPCFSEEYTEIHLDGTTPPDEEQDLNRFPLSEWHDGCQSPLDLVFEVALESLKPPPAPPGCVPAKGKGKGKGKGMPCAPPLPPPPLPRLKKIQKK
eukprot:TRINITY_DN545_c2_g1_i1.p1 TRINITY_DN545_c2_g1~~TRINITY_DN545_c2_g1_i1.p1  ORF type:complete len:610 (-),score=112.58 TRINITY_DN545_c2_g1_i1:116-1945(-)